MMTYSIWMKMPDKDGGWSRVAGPLSKEDAEKLAAAFLFPVHVDPDAEAG